jgi:hypothetical protein
MESTNHLGLNRGLHSVHCWCYIIIVVRERLENVHWEVLKVNAKIKMDHRETACYVDELTVVTSKCPYFLKNL